MRILIALLVVVLLALQYRLWIADGGFRDARELRRELEAQVEENRRLAERNAALEAEVEDLKAGLAAIEERARTEMGMIKEGETFYQVIKDDDDDDDNDE